MKQIFLIISILLLASCQSSNQARQKDLQKIWGQYFNNEFNDTKAIDVLVATNRAAKSTEFGCSDKNFGTDYSDKLKFGVCKINVPKNHNTGEINVGDNHQSSNDYFKTLSSQSFDKDSFITNLKKSKLPALIFVHGFNVKYNYAVLRAAGIAYDLKYPGPIVLFTWPAGPKDGFFEDEFLNITYINNLVSAKQSIEIFKNFLLELQKNKIEINLIVHSMGHQVVLPALAKISQEKSKQVLINHLILNAPDFSVAEFKGLSGNLKQVSQNITLYCSSNDRAMDISKTFNNNDRLGACTPEDFKPIETINVRLVSDETVGLGHSYYSSRAILTDVFQNLLGIPASQRLFIIKSEPNSTEQYLLRN